MKEKAFIISAKTFDGKEKIAPLFVPIPEAGVDMPSYEDLAAVGDRITVTEKRITNLEKGVAADSFETDDSVAYVKSVPANAAPYAAISKVGGMTHRVNVGTEEAPVYELRHAAVTGLKVTGKNIFGGEALADKIVEMVNTATKDASTGTVAFTAPAISGKILFSDFKPNTAYTIILYGICGYSSATNLIIVYEDGTNEKLRFASSSAESYCVFTTSATKTVRTLSGLNMGGTTTLYYDKCGIFEGVLTAEDFEPYVENLAMTIPEAVKALDAYGCSVTKSSYNYIDFEEGQYTQTVGVVDMGTLNWEFRTSSNVFASSALTPASKVGNTETGKEICGGYTTIPSNQISASSADKSIAIGLNSIVYVVDRSFGSDVAAFKAAMSGVMLYYALATPEVTDISDLLPADNLIEVEGGGTITFENEHGLAVPSEVIYQTKGAAV